MNTNNRLLRVLNHQPVDRTPIWIMRQAGRYLPEYQAIRRQVPDFLTLCKTPELACEVTLQPLRRFPLDAAIIFSDILTVPEAMGMELNFIEGVGPVFNNPIRSEMQIKKLVPEIHLNYLSSAIHLVKKALGDKTPLIGFAGSPWTIASYMVEGKTSKNFETIKTLRYQNPTLLHALLQKLTAAVTMSLRAQIEAGVDVVMLFDTWGGVLNPEDYQNFSLAYMEQIFNQLRASANTIFIPRILFTKGGGQWLESMAHSSCEAIGLDWTTDFITAQKKVPPSKILQGNLDPCVLFSSPDFIRQQVTQLLAQVGTRRGHIFNLGHGILPQTPIGNVEALIQAVQELSPQYHCS